MTTGPRGGALFVDDFEPRTAFGVGHPRGIQILRALAATFDVVQVCPLEGLLSDRAPDETLPANVRTGARPGGEIVRAELSARREAWRVVWIARPHNIVRIAKLHRAEPRLFDGVRVIYDAEAVFALRTYRKQVLAGAPLSELQQRRALRAELLPTEIADHIVSVSHEERDIIRSYVTRPVEILGYGAGIVAATPSFASRRDLLFVGAVPVIETPNAESLQWFARDVLPAVAAAGLRLTVAGSGTQPTGALQSLAGPAFQLAGPQDDLAPVYAQARVFVAPTRYACGIPLKVLDAARHGVPVVMSPLLAHQLRWRDGVEALVGASPAAFADAIRRLHDDESLWQRLRDGAYSALRRDFDPAAFDATVRRVATGSA